MAGGASGPSYVLTPSGGAAPWQTDIAGGDGTRMRTAITRYYNWYWANPSTRGTLSSIKTAMIGDFSTSAYDQARKQALVDEIVRVYNLYVSNNNGLRVQPPTTDQATLGFLGIRKQCLEWANSISLANGGGARAYGAASVANAADHRPGMMYRNSSSTHAAIIVEIKIVSNVRQYRLAEANWGTGWINPNGMVRGSAPWRMGGGLHSRLVTA